MNACYTPFLRKTKEWSYEKEVRMVFGISESPKLVNYDGIWFYPNVKVRSIFIGCKMDKQKREEIERKCRERGIPVHHLSVKKGANKLFVED